MKKLEDIPKKEVFSTPDGYFDSLPTRIQSRIVEKGGKKEYVFTFQTAWKLAVPVVVLLVVGIFWFTSPSQPADAESILAAVQTEDLIAYLGESDISTEEVIDAGGFNAEDIDEIAGEVYDLQNIDLEGIDLDDLGLETELK